MKVELKNARQQEILDELTKDGAVFSAALTKAVQSNPNAPEYGIFCGQQKNGIGELFVIVKRQDLECFDSESRVAWHLFPAETPPVNGWYLVTLLHDEEPKIEVYYLHWDPVGWILGDPKATVLAWAYLPEPFRPQADLFE